MYYIEWVSKYDFSSVSFWEILHVWSGFAVKRKPQHKATDGNPIYLQYLQDNRQLPLCYLEKVDCEYIAKRRDFCSLQLTEVHSFSLWGLFSAWQLCYSYSWVSIMFTCLVVIRTEQALTCCNQSVLLQQPGFSSDQQNASGLRRRMRLWCLASMIYLQPLVVQGIQYCPWM